MRESASGADVIGLGIAFAAGGGYFLLVASGLLPQPNDSFASTPSAAVYAIGLSFLFAAFVCMVRAPAGALTRIGGGPQRVFAIALAVALAIIGTCLATGSGLLPRSSGADAPAGEAIGLTVFALGATIAWIYAIALTVSTIGKLFSRKAGAIAKPGEGADWGATPRG